jgi:hypothetical protein
MALNKADRHIINEERGDESFMDENCLHILFLTHYNLGS